MLSESGQKMWAISVQPKRKKVGMSKTSFLNYFCYFLGSLLTASFLWRAKESFELVQFNNHTISFVPKSSSISVFKTTSGKGLSKIDASGRNRNLDYIPSVVDYFCPPRFFHSLMQRQ